MASVFNTNKERSIIHVVGTGKAAKRYVLAPNKLSEVPDDVLALMRTGLTESQNATLITGDADINKARASAQALVNQAEARATAAETQAAEFKARVEALEKMVLELQTTKAGKR
jgi:hypothetical protein